MKLKLSALGLLILMLVLTGVVWTYAEGYDIYAIQLVEFKNNENISMAAINTDGAILVSDPGKSTKTYSAGGSNLFKFTPTTTGFYSIKSVSESSSTRLYLYNSLGEQIFSCNYGRAGDNIYDCHMGEELVANNTYFVRIESTKAATFPVYFYADDHSDGTNAPTPVSVANDYFGELNYNSDRDVFSFVPSLSGRYSIKLQGNGDTIARIYKDIEHTAAEIVSAEIVDNAYTIVADFMAGSKYFIDVYGRNEFTQGNYTLNVSAYGISESHSSSNVFCSGTKKHIAIPAGSTLQYKLIFPYAGKYNFESTFDSDLSVKICESSGIIKGTIMDYGYEYYSSILTFLQSDKIYYIVINNNSNVLKNIDLFFDIDDVGNDYINYTQVLNTPIAAKINYSGDKDVFLSQSNCVKIMSNTELYVTVDDDGWYGFSGTYTGKEIVISSDYYDYFYITISSKSADGIGEYSIVVGEEEQDCTTLQIGSNYSVDINSLSETKLFKYIPSESGYYFLDAGFMTDYYFTMDILDFLHNSVINNPNDGFNSKVWLEKDKIYYFRAGIYEDVGTYSFEFRKDDYFNGGAMPYYNNSLSESNFVEGKLDYSGDFDCFDIDIYEGLYRIKNTTSTDVNLAVSNTYNDDLIAEGEEVVLDFSSLEDAYPYVAVYGSTNQTLGKYKILAELLDGSLSIPAKISDIINIEIKDDLVENQTSTYTISFSSSDFEVYDANGMTFELDTIAGNSGSGIFIDSVTPTSVTFTVTGEGSVFKDVLNVVRLKAKRTGTCRYYLEKIV